MTVDSQLLLRMIDDDEYFQMVGGSADDVVEVLLLAPCEGEALSVNAHRFDTVASRLKGLTALAPRERAMLRFLTLRENEVMAGHYGYLIRHGVLIELEPVLRRVTVEQLQAEFARYPGWMRRAGPADVALHVAEFERLRTFISEAVRRGRSLHLVDEIRLEPRHYPHRTRQRLSRIAKQARRAAHGKAAGEAVVRVTREPASPTNGRQPAVPNRAPGCMFDVRTAPDPAPGLVWGIISDALTGTQLSGVEIALSQGGGAVWSTTTGEQGQFEIGPLDPGDYAFSAHRGDRELADGHAVSVDADLATIIEAAFNV